MATEIDPDLLARLPIVAYADRRRHLRKIALFSYFAGLGAFISFCAITAPFLEVPLLVRLLSPMMLMVSVPIVGWTLPMALTLVSDLRVRGPILMIDRHEFVDRRSGVSIAWPEIRSIRFIDSPPGSNAGLLAGVTIRPKNKTKLPGPTWKRRIKPLLTKADEFHCSVALLTETAEPLAWKMTALVKQAGGAVWNPREPYPMWKATRDLYADIFSCVFSRDPTDPNSC